MFHRRPLSVIAVLCGVVFLTPTTAWAQLGNLVQAVDPLFVANVPNPEYPLDTGPIVAVDETHGNFGSLANLAKHLETLLEADGYRVQPFTTEWDDSYDTNPYDSPYWEALSQVDVLVLANPTVAISQPEADLIAIWVLAWGGNLVLSADHNQNWQANVANLASHFQMQFVTPSTPPTLFTPVGPDFLNQSHPVGSGLNDLLVMNGSSFSIGLPPGAFVFSTPVLTYADSSNSGVAIQFLLGRVFITGETSILAAQGIVPPQCRNPDFTVTPPCGGNCCVVLFCLAFGMDATECAPYEAAGVAPGAGFNRDDDGQAYTLNIFHWVDGD